jgi:L-rhamnose-H+ transport protein
MIPVTPNPFLGIGMHSVGAMFAANCYAPQKFIRRWSWETFWVAQAAWCWLLWPIIGAALTIPELGAVLSEAVHTCPRSLLGSFLLSMAYGVGGIAFNVSIRYIGFALTYAIAVGLSGVLGTLIPPLVRGQFSAILAKAGSGWVLAGIGIGTLGIALCGIAGRLKEQDLAKHAQGDSGFNMRKGLLLSLLAGVLSAMYGFAIEVAAPVTALAEQHGAGYWQGNVAYLTANSGAFITSMIYCVWLARKNQSSGEFLHVSQGKESGTLWKNYGIAWLCGTLWYGQFFFYNLGHVRMGEYQFTSWGIHMIMLVLFSNLTGVLFREWKGTTTRTRIIITAGLLVLVASVLSLAYGNYLGGS